MAHADEPTDDWEAQPPRPERTRFPAARDEPDDAPAGDAEPPDPVSPGAVLMVPNHDWGFENPNSTDHPGVCTAHPPNSWRAVFVSGTTARKHHRARPDYFVVEPTEPNGLRNPTAFRLCPRVLRVHRLRLMTPRRHLGYLDAATLQALRAKLAAAHPPEPPPCA